MTPDSPSPVRVLLIEDSPTDADLISEALSDVQATSLISFDLRVAVSLKEGLAGLTEHDVNVVLLDLTLPDSEGLETFDRVRAMAPSIPIVVLTGLADDELAGRAVRHGAQDFLVKGSISDESLARTLRHAVERKISENRRAEELQEQAKGAERRLLFLAETIPQIVWTARADGEIDYFNQRWYEFTGLPADQSSTATWSEAIHSDDRAQAATAWSEALTSGGSFEIEYRLRRRDGEYRWHIGRAEALRTEAGPVLHWFGTSTDIHDQREVAEERTRLVETIHRVGAALTAELDLEKVVQAVTDAATDVSAAEYGAFFYNPVDERGESYSLYAISGIHHQRVQDFPMPRNTQIFAPTFRGEGVVRLDDVTADPRYAQSSPREDVPLGGVPVRSYLAVPVVSRQGLVHGGLFLGHSRKGEFSERQERLVSGIAAQAAIAIDNARLYQQVNQAVQARDDFLAAVAHDLRTPLTAIKGVAQLTRRRVAAGRSDQVIEALERIDGTATRMSDQISELLDIARLRLGQPLEMDWQDVDLVRLTQDTIEQFQAAATRHSFTLSVEPGGPLIGSWDASRLVRVVENLLDNAVKYSPDGGQVEASIHREGSDAVLNIRDHGMGIPEREQEQIFERFRRASNVVGTIAGTGIGLAGSRHVVELLGGSLRVISREGVGSTFTIRLPLTTPRDKHIPAVEPARSA